MLSICETSLYCKSGPTIGYKKAAALGSGCEGAGSCAKVLSLGPLPQAAKCLQPALCIATTCSCQARAEGITGTTIPFCNMVDFRLQLNIFLCFISTLNLVYKA